MTPYWRSRRRPPWWPEQESWPPKGPGWERRRRRFVRRAGIAVGAMLLLSLIGGVTLVSTLVERVGAGRIGGPGIAVAVIILLAGVAFVLLFAGAMRRLAVPVSEVVTAAGRAGDGDFSVRVREVGPPFLRVVARAFNRMVARLKVQDEERRQLMADVAHELRTPLSVMQGRLEGILDGVYPADETHVKALLDDTRVLGRLGEDLRTLANAESAAFVLKREPTDLGVLVTETVRSLRARAEAQHVRVTSSIASVLPLVEIDPLRIREVLTNVMANALQHTPPDGVVSVSVAQQDERIVMVVTDTGSGIAPEDLPKVFDRFYKGPQSRGSGLGLAIARKFVVAHGGEIRASSEAARGTTITITLPLAHDGNLSQ